MKTAIFQNAITPETAVVVDDYPYGFQLRTQIRYWIESKSVGKSTQGQRMCSQTLNPKTGTWNKPKKTTYEQLMVLYVNPESGYVTYAGWNYYGGEEKLVKFADRFELDLPRWEFAKKTLGDYAKLKQMGYRGYKIPSTETY